MLTINLLDGYIDIIGDPRVPAGLKTELGYWQRVSELVGYQRKMTNVRRECFVARTQIEADGAHEVLVTMPGLAGRIKTFLTSKRIPFTMNDMRASFPEPDIRAAMQGMRRSQVECVYTALKSGGGIVAAATGFGKSHVIGAIIRAYDPELLRARNTPTCVVTAKDKDICVQNYNTMVGLFPDRDVGLLMSGKTKRSDDIQVVTLDSLHKVNMAEVGILIVDEVHEAATASRSDQLAKAVNARRWGVSATPSGRFDNADLVTEGLVGPVIYKYTYADGVRDGVLVPIEVLWLQVPEPTTIRLAAYMQLKQRLAKYRHAAEQNPGQTALIQDIIRSTPESHQLLCIMQHTEQMNTLAGGLPDVTCVHAVTNTASLVAKGNTNLHGVSVKRRKQIYDEVKAGEIRKIMSTYVYKQGVDFPELSVLVQAGGGGSAIASAQIPGRGSRPSEGKERAFLVDFWHPWDQYVNDKDGGPALKDGPVLRDDKARRRVYKKLGFTQSPVSTVADLPFLGKPGAQPELSWT